MVASFAEATYSNQWSYSHPCFRTKTNAPYARAAEDEEYDSPGPGHYDIPSMFGARHQPGLTSSFATRSGRFANIRTFTGSIGPASYTPVVSGFQRFARASTAPGVPKTSQGTPVIGSVRYSTIAPRFARCEHHVGGPDSVSTPGPGSYELWDTGAMPKAARVSNSVRSQINDVYGDGRALVICKVPNTPSPQQYARVPQVDRLRMAMRNPPTHSRLTLIPGGLDQSLRSLSNLSSTLDALSKRAN